MSKINVNVIDPSIAVPNTGGEISGFSGDNASLSIIPIILAVIILGVLVFAYFHKSGMRLHKQSGHFSIRHTKTKITSFFILSLVIVGSIVVLDQQEKSTEFVGAADNTLSITVGDASMDVIKSESGAFAAVGSDITVNSSTDGGYVLTVSAESSDLTLESDVEDDDNSNVISGLSTSGNTTLAANTWGIAISQSTEPTNDESNPVWQKVPSTVDSALTIKETDIATPANDKTTVYYGVNVNDQLPSGNYTNTLVYTAVAKPVLTCDVNKICYSDNGANSVSKMGSQTVASDAAEVTLWASNYQYSNHGFAGWNTKADGTGVKYGPNETIVLPDDMSEGLKLYAMWIKSAGSLQNWSGCGSLAQGDTTALTDERDGDTYAVAKLADGKCWMIENLRLENTASHNADGSLAQGYNSSFIGLATPEIADFSNSTTPNSLYSTDGSTAAPAITGEHTDYRFPRYNNSNTWFRQSVSWYSTDNNTYSYGNYYTWHTAIADTTYYPSDDHNTTSICPLGWRIPTGKDTTGEFALLDIALGGNGTTSTSITDPTGAVMSNKYRSYPNNFLYSGVFSGSSAMYRSMYGEYWSSTAFGYYTSYHLFLSDEIVGSGINSQKSSGQAIRCILGS